MDPDEFMNRLLSSPPMTFHVPETATVRLADRHDGSHLLAGATITAWQESDE